MPSWSWSPFFKSRTSLALTTIGTKRSSNKVRVCCWKLDSCYFPTLRKKTTPFEKIVGKHWLLSSAEASLIWLVWLSPQKKERKWRTIRCARNSKPRSTFIYAIKGSCTLLWRLFLAVWTRKHCLTIRWHLLSSSAPTLTSVFQSFGKSCYQYLRGLMIHRSRNGHRLSSRIRNAVS